MSQPPDLKALAGRYVELWQDQLCAMAADSELVATMTRTLELFGVGSATPTMLWQSFWTVLECQATADKKKEASRDARKLDPHFPSAARTQPVDASLRTTGTLDVSKGRPAMQTEEIRSEAPSFASDEFSRLIGKLQARLTLIEERLVSLERGTERKGGKSLP